jgi:hypothetical protein
MPRSNDLLEADTARAVAVQRSQVGGAHVSLLLLLPVPRTAYLVRVGFRQILPSLSRRHRVRHKSSEHRRRGGFNSITGARHLITHTHYTSRAPPTGAGCRVRGAPGKEDPNLHPSRVQTQMSCADTNATETSYLLQRRFAVVVLCH